MLPHKTFCAFGAYVVDFSNQPQIRLMPIPNAFKRNADPTRFVTLNLDKRLLLAAWDEVMLDTTGLGQDGENKEILAAYDDLDGINLLTIGPVFPGQTEGGIYIERSKFFTEIRPIFDPGKDAWPDGDLHPYELMSSALLRGDPPTRYHGFHATVKSLGASGSTKKLSIKRASGGPVEVELDMTNRDQCDDPALLAQDVLDPARPRKSESVLDASSLPGDQGAVFLSLNVCVKNLLHGPKEPISAG
jgi:hypothetical protein